MEEINMRVLENCEPKQVFYYFEEICKIPHGSRNTKQISDYLVAFAKEHGFDYVQDEMNNVIIYKPATPGYENAPTVILQGHMDMVCEKRPANYGSMNGSTVKAIRSRSRCGCPTWARDGRSSFVFRTGAPAAIRAVFRR